MVIRIPRTNWKPYRNGGMSITNNYGGVQVLSEDATYVYVEVKLPQGALDGNYYRPVNLVHINGLEEILVSMPAGSTGILPL